MEHILWSMIWSPTVWSGLGTPLPKSKLAKNLPLVAQLLTLSTALWEQIRASSHYLGILGAQAGPGDNHGQRNVPHEVETTLNSL